MLRRESGKAGFGTKRITEKQESKQATPTPPQPTGPEHALTEMCPNTANPDESRGKD